jgi:hypothetical protein
MQSRACVARGLLAGIILLVGGTLILLLNIGVFNTVVFRTWWPLLLIAAGAAKLVHRGTWYRHRKPYSDFA